MLHEPRFVGGQIAMQPAPNLVRSFFSSLSPYRLFSFCLNNMLSLSMGEGVVLYFLVLVFVCIFRFDGEWVGLKKTSNDDIVGHISLHELEHLFMTTPFM